MKAVWIRDYDYQTDRGYKRPGCPDCNAPIGKGEDGKYHCFPCGRVAEGVDKNMLAWLEPREESKTEMNDCYKFEHKGRTIGCDGKACVETHYVRNPVTMKWRVAWSVCRNCGQKIIV